MLPYKRTDRVSDLIREEVANIIMYKLKDPRIGFLTVTGAAVSPDMRTAKVYVSVLAESERESTLDVLNSARNFIHSMLSKRLKMKFIPKIEFMIDTSIQYGFKMDRLLKEISEDNAVAGEDGENFTTKKSREPEDEKEHSGREE